MSVVKINALTVPAGQEEALEQRFVGRGHGLDEQIGFEGYQLLRPVAGETRYFVVSTWQNEDAYQAWRASDSGTHHGSSSAPVASGAELLEFETVEL